MMAHLKNFLSAQWRVHNQALRSGGCVAAAALLTFTFYQYFNLKYGYWGVVSVAAVMQRSFYLTWVKARARLMGTTLGVLWAAVMIIVLNYWPSTLEGVFFVGLWVVCLIVFSKPTWSYCGIVAGITFIFIVSVNHTDPQLWRAVSVSRTINIWVGVLLTCSCYGLFLFHHATLKAASHPPPVPAVWHYKAALLMAAATTLSLFPWLHWPYEGGVWAPIACLFVVEENFDKTISKAWLRLFAHIIVVLIAAALSLLCGTLLGTSVALGIAMFFFGYWIEKPLWGFESNLANTMGIAFCVILLNEPGEWGVWHSIEARMLNTLLGIACGIVVVKVIQHYLPRLVKPIYARVRQHESMK